MHLKIISKKYVIHLIFKFKALSFLQLLLFWTQLYFCFCFQFFFFGHIVRAVHHVTWDQILKMPSFSLHLRVSVVGKSIWAAENHT